MFKFPLTRRIFKRGEWNQYIAGCVAGLSYGCCGISYAWVNPILISIMSPRSTITMSLRQVGWAATLPQLGSVLSPIFAGYLADKVGRKTLLLATAPLQVATWIAFTFSSHFIAISVLRTFQGVVMGCVETVLPMYLGEIADSWNRGKVSVLYSLGWNLGLLYEYSVGPFTRVNQLDWLNAVPPTVFLIIFIWFPESPYYLVLRGRIEDAQKALSWFRDEGVSSREELLNIESLIEEERANLSDWTDIFKKREGRKGVIIVVIICLTFNLCGAMPVLSYCNRTFVLVTGQKLLSEYLTIGIGLILTLVTLVTLFTVDKVGRRVVLILSYAGSLLCLVPTAVYFYLELDYPEEAKKYYLVPVIGMVVFPSFITLGAMTIVHTYQSELFSTTTRSIGSAIIVFVSGITAAVSLETFFPLEDHNEDYINFTIYSFVSLFGLLFCIFVAPETKGYDLEEIHKTLV